MTIHSAAELEHAGNTVAFSRVDDSWGLDWKCFWSGWSDSAQEGSYTWVSKKNPAFVPSFGPFEAGNGEGELEDCVAICQPDCWNTTKPCVDLGAYGYTGNFLIDTKCADEYSFCCDGLAAEYVSAEKLGSVHVEPEPEKEKEKEPLPAVEILLGLWGALATFAAFSAMRLAHTRGKANAIMARGGAGGAMELSMLPGNTGMNDL